MEKHGFTSKSSVHIVHKTEISLRYQLAWDLTKCFKLYDYMVRAGTHYVNLLHVP